jgi:hypothetical protein
MSVDGFRSDDGGAGVPPASNYNSSSEGMGGISDDEDAGEEAKWAGENDTGNVGRGLENLSKVSLSPNLASSHCHLFTRAS